MGRLLSDRLMVLLRGEIYAFERAARQDRSVTAGGKRPAGAGAGAGVGVKVGVDGVGVDGAVAGRAAPGAGRKERIDALSLLTRTLEKLLDLKRLELLAGKGGEEEDGETVRLREELMARLKALDARRAGRMRLFDAEDGPAQIASAASCAATPVDASDVAAN